jgi:hypothetical protein
VPDAAADDTDAVDDEKTPPSLRAADREVSDGDSGAPPPPPPPPLLPPPETTLPAAPPPRAEALSEVDGIVEADTPSNTDGCGTRAECAGAERERGVDECDASAASERPEKPRSCMPRSCAPRGVSTTPSGDTMDTDSLWPVCTGDDDSKLELDARGDTERGRGRGAAYDAIVSSAAAGSESIRLRYTRVASTLLCNDTPTT